MVCQLGRSIHALNTQRPASIRVPVESTVCCKSLKLQQRLFGNSRSCEGRFLSNTVQQNSGGRRIRGGLLVTAALDGEEAPLVNSEDVFKKALQENEVLVVDWMAKWCRKCIYLKPKLERLFKAEFPEFAHMFVDVNAVPSGMVIGAGVKKMPTIQIYVKGEKVAEHIAAEGGVASVEKIRQLLKDSVPSAAGVA